MATRDRNKTNYILYALIVLLISHDLSVDAKRIYTSGGSRRSSSSSSSSVRRTSTNNRPAPGNTYGGTHSSGGSHSNPSLSHTGLTSLSYPNYNSQPNRKPATNTHSSAPRPTSTPIGWNVPAKPQGPPPAYSPTNPIGGAHANINAKPPAYNPNYAAPPSYSQSTNTNNRPITPTNYNNQQSSYNRNRLNSTGGFGSGAAHTPITATNNRNVQSSYPQQGANYYPAGSSLPAGATYHPSGQLPAGATYHPSGQLPAGATYHPAGHLPAGATYHPAGHLPAGATYHQAGHVPAGATYYPSASSLPAGATYHSPGHLPPGASYYPAAPMHAPAYYPSPAALPAGATFLPAGSALPAGATFIQQPQKSSSGLGFGTGLLTGAVVGGIAGHYLTPTQTRVVEHAPSYGGGGGYGGGSAPHNDDKIIIINNGPPGSVSTTDVGGGTTVINTNQPQAPAPAGASGPAPAAGPAPFYPPAAPQPTPNLAPINPTYTNPNYNAGTVNPTPAAGAAAAGAAVAGVTPAGDPAATQQPPLTPGQLVCIPVKVPQPDPNDSTKTIEVEQIACYEVPAEPTPTSTVAGTNSSTVPPTTAMAPAQPTTFESSVALAPLQSAQTTPVTVPHDSVALAPFNPSAPPDILKIPGTGLLTGAVVGGIAGHYLTPTQTRVVEHAPSYGGGGGYGGGSAPHNDDKIIIINNGPPGSVSTTDVGGGTTVINTNQPQAPAPAGASGPAPAAGPAPFYPPAAPQPTPNLAPINPTYTNPNYNAGTVNPTPAAGAAAAGAAVAGVTPAGDPAATQQPPLTPGQLVCIPVKVPQPDPNDSTKTIEVEQIACYEVPAEPTPTSTVAGTNSSTVPPTTAMAPAQPTTFESSVALAPLQSAQTTPVTVPHDSVALAPFNPSAPPDILKIPGEYNTNQRKSSLMSESSGIRVASGSAHNYGSMGLVTLVTLLIAGYWQ